MSQFAGRWGAWFFGIGAVFPIVFSVGYALLYSVGWAGVMADGLTFAHWAKVWTKNEVIPSLLFSAYVSTICTIAGWLFAAFIFVHLHRKWLQSNWAIVWYLPFALPAMVAGFFTFQLFSGGGWLARIAFHLGWITSPQAFPEWVQDPYGIGIVMAHLLTGVPFFLLLFRTLWKDATVDAYSELSISLGASISQTRWRVQLPILFQRSKGTILLYFLAVFGAYDIPLMVGSQSPQMISVLTLRKFERFDLADKPEAFIMALLYTAILCAILLTRNVIDENP